MKIKLLNAWLCTRKGKSFECEIVTNCFKTLSDECTTEYRYAKKPGFFILRHETVAQWTFIWFNADAEIYCYVLDLIQEYQTFWYTSFFPSNKQTIINI